VRRSKLGKRRGKPPSRVGRNIRNKTTAQSVFRHSYQPTEEGTGPREAGGKRAGFKGGLGGGKERTLGHKVPRLGEKEEEYAFQGEIEGKK